MQMKLWKGNVFTSVYQEFCPGEVYTPCPRVDTPQQTSLADTSGRHPPSTHPWQTPPGSWLLQRMVPIILECILVVDASTGRERLIRSHSSARFCFELSGNSN